VYHLPIFLHIFTAHAVTVTISETQTPRPFLGQLYNLWWWVCVRRQLWAFVVGCAVGKHAQCVRVCCQQSVRVHTC